MGNSAPKKTPKELARENKRVVDRAVRQIDRERTKLEGNEKKLLEEIKKRRPSRSSRKISLSKWSVR